MTPLVLYKNLLIPRKFCAVCKDMFLSFYVMLSQILKSNISKLQEVQIEPFLILADQWHVLSAIVYIAIYVFCKNPHLISRHFSINFMVSQILKSNISRLQKVQIKLFNFGWLNVKNNALTLILLDELFHEFFFFFVIFMSLFIEILF